MGILYDQGNFQFEDKITKFWPEYGQNGKEDTRICDVLRHESGLSYFSEILPSTDVLWTENIKQNKVGEIIEKEAPHWPEKPGKSDSKFQYHGFTRGVIINEIARRIDTKGRTMDEIIRDEIKIDNILVTVKNEEEKAKIWRQTHNTLGNNLKQLLIPKWAGRRMEITWSGFIGLMKDLGKIFAGFGTPLFPESLAVKNGQDNADLLQVSLFLTFLTGLFTFFNNAIRAGKIGGKFKTFSFVDFNLILF